MFRSYISVTGLYRFKQPLIRQIGSRNSLSERLINANIPHKLVTVVQTDGRLSETPTSLTSLLEKINHSTEFVELVGDGGRPIVKIRQKKDVFEQERLKRRKQLTNRVVRKEIQISWVISDGDLAHKLTQAHKYLEKGYGVSIAFAAKPGQRIPPQEARDNLVDRVKQYLGDTGKFQRLETLARSLIAHFTPSATGKGYQTGESMSNQQED